MCFHPSGVLGWGLGLFADLLFVRTCNSPDFLWDWRMVHNMLLKPQTSLYTWKYQLAPLLSFYPPPREGKEQGGFQPRLHKMLYESSGERFCVEHASASIGGSPRDRGSTVRK